MPLNTLDLLYTLLFMTLPVLLVVIILVRHRFFVVSTPEESRVSWSLLLAGACAYFLPPLFVGTFFYLFLSYSVWINISGTLLGGIALIICAVVFHWERVLLLYDRKWLKHFIWGACTWCLALPLIMFITMLVYFGLSLFGVQHLPEQVVMSLVKEATDNPLLFGTQLLLVIVVAPFSEEILFRGLIQNLMLKYWGRNQAVLISSFLFALFHYSSLQGLTNISIVLSLFIFSLFLGTLYEKYQSLWAPIGLHVTFNTVSVITALFVDGLC